jgi:hypothetical protein
MRANWLRWQTYLCPDLSSPQNSDDDINLPVTTGWKQLRGEICGAYMPASVSGEHDDIPPRRVLKNQGKWCFCLKQFRAEVAPAFCEVVWLQNMEIFNDKHIA